MFTLELLVTQKCNLGCPYCYVSNRNTFMSNEIFDDIFSRLHGIIERSGEPNYHVSFFGGEPLLNWELIEYAVPKFKSDPLCKGIVVISNMTLIDEYKSDFLLRNGISVSWSFDGISSNESRPLLKVPENADYVDSSGGILDMYQDRKELLLKHVDGCKFMVWPGNSQTMVDNLEFFVDWGLNFPDYSIVRDDVWTKEDIINFRTDIKQLTSRVAKYILEDDILVVPGFYSLYIADTMLGLSKGKRPFGCFAGCRGMAIMPDGSAFPCARFGSKRIMEIDEDYDFMYYQDKFNPQNFDKCQECTLYKVCNAGCTYSQVRNDNKPLDSICELFHILHEEAHILLHMCKDNPKFQDFLLNQFRNLG